MRTCFCVVVLILALSVAACQCCRTEPAVLSSTLNEKLKKMIKDKKIIFDSGSEKRLREELLRENSGTKITTTLQELVLDLAKTTKTHVRVSDLIRTKGDSLHVKGRAVDIGNEDIAKTLLPKMATAKKVKDLSIDEIIFDAKKAGEGDRNKWNYDKGKKHKYDKKTLDEHGDHMHFAVTK